MQWPPRLHASIDLEDATYQTPTSRKFADRHADWPPGAASVAITALILLGRCTASWLRESPVEVRTGASREPFPIVRDGERRLDRARSLRDAGRLREALRELDVVELGDPLRPEADQLRSEIQRVLCQQPKAARNGGNDPDEVPEV